MKRAGWQLLLAGAVLILAAHALRAQTSEQLPEPTSVMNHAPAAAPAAAQPSTPATMRPSAASTPPGTSPIMSRDRAWDQQPDLRNGEDQPDLYADDMGDPYDETCDDGPAYPFTSSQWWRDGCWYSEFEFVVWHRSRAHDGRLGLDTSGILPGQRQDLNRHGTQLGLAPGGSGTLGYILDRDLDNRDHSIEFTYLGFNNWQAYDSLRSENPQSLRTPIAPNYGGFNFADTYSTVYRSSLQTMEINYRIRNRPGRDQMIMGPDGFWSRQLTPGRTQSLIIGLSGLQINEDFRWVSLQDNVSPAVFSGNFHTHTDNTLLGPQIGGDCFDVHDRWYWGVRGTVGIYANFSRGSSDIIVNDPNTPEAPVHGQSTSQTPSGFGKLSVLTGINVNDHIMIFSSYDVAAVGGLAMAPDQVSFFGLMSATPPTMNTGGHIFYNGFAFGLEAYW